MDKLGIYQYSEHFESRNDDVPQKNVPIWILENVQNTDKQLYRYLGSTHKGREQVLTVRLMIWEFLLCQA